MTNIADSFPRDKTMPGDGAKKKKKRRRKKKKKK